MATNTTNYGFKKPDESDFYDVADQNKNWDLADEALKNLDTPTFEDYTGSTAVPSATDAIDQIKSKGKLGTLLANIKAAFKGACLIGHIVNSCVSDRADLPLSAAQGKVLKDLYTQLYSDLNTTNNNLSQYNFNLGNTTADNHEKIDRIATFSGFTWVNENYNSNFGGQWCFVDSFLIANGAALQRITSAQTSTILATRYCNNGVWGNWNVGVTKSDLASLDATLSIREENGGVLVSFGSKDSKYGIYIGVGPNGVNTNYKLNGEWKKAIIIATQS